MKYTLESAHWGLNSTFQSPNASLSGQRRRATKWIYIYKKMSHSISFKRGNRHRRALEV